jgi:hypothetical protein
MPVLSNCLAGCCDDVGWLAYCNELAMVGYVSVELLLTVGLTNTRGQ